MSDLKPCPFCGGEIEIVKTDCNDPIHGYGLVHENNDCILTNDGYLQIYSTEEQAIEAWNTRSEKPCVSEDSGLVIHPSNAGNRITIRSKGDE